MCSINTFKFFIEECIFLIHLILLYINYKKKAREVSQEDT